MGRRLHLRISYDVWLERRWTALAPESQLVFWYLCCHERTSTGPTFDLDVDGWMADLDMTLTELWLALGPLLDLGWLAFDENDDLRLTDRGLEYYILPTAHAHVDRERARITWEVKRAVYKRDGKVCRACGAIEDLCVDHVHALAVGGTSDMDNLAVLCRSCNSSKGTKSWAAFMEGRQ